MAPEEPVKMCPVWQHECYGEKCQAWKDDRCEIIHMATLSFTSWGQPTYFDPSKVKFWDSPFTCSGSERITW